MITDLAAQQVVSRKFAYEQVNTVSVALDEIFTSSALDDAVLFELLVAKMWLRQLTLGLSLICSGSYRGVIELVRDLLGMSTTEETAYNMLQAAARRAGPISCNMNPLSIRVGLHNEIFQGDPLLLAGVDAKSG